MQVGISTASFFTKLQTEETLLPITKLGADRYEVFLSGFVEYERAFIDDLHERQSALGLTCTALHTLGSQFEPQLFSIAQRQRQGSEYVFEKTLEDAAKLGAPLYVMHGLFHLKQTAMNPNFERWGQRLCELCEIASSFGVRLTLENVHWCMYARSGLAKLLDPHIKDSNLGYTLDVKQAMQSGDAIQDYLLDMGARLCNVHLCDVLMRGDQMQTCLPGHGMVDFMALSEALKQKNPQAFVTMEVYAPDYRDMEEF